MASTGGWTRSGEAGGTFELARDATLRVRPGRHGLTLRARRGTVLVTQAGDPDDHVLAPGDALWLPHGGAVVIWALTPARVTAEVVRAERAHRLAPEAAAA